MSWGARCDVWLWGWFLGQVLRALRCKANGWTLHSTMETERQPEPVHCNTVPPNLEQSCWDGNALQPIWGGIEVLSWFLQDENHDERGDGGEEELTLVRRCGSLIKGNKSSSPSCLGQCAALPTGLENSFLFREVLSEHVTMLSITQQVE